MALHPSFPPLGEDGFTTTPNTYWCLSCTVIVPRNCMEHHKAGDHRSDSYNMKNFHWEHPTVAPQAQSYDMAPTATQGLDDINERLSAMEARLAETHWELIEATKERQQTNNGLHSTAEHEDALAHENYMILRCKAIKENIADIKDERSKYIANVLHINPDTDIPLLAD